MDCWCLAKTKSKMSPQRRVTVCELREIANIGAARSHVFASFDRKCSVLTTRKASVVGPPEAKNRVERGCREPKRI